MEANEQEVSFFWHICVPDREQLREGRIAPEHAQGQGQLSKVVCQCLGDERRDSHPIPTNKTYDAQRGKGNPDGGHECPSPEHVGVPPRGE